MVAPDHLALRTQGGGVEQPARRVTVDVADDGRAAPGGCGHPGEDGLVVGHEGRPPEQVLGWVAGDGQLREHGQVGPALFGGVQRRRDPLRVAVEVAHHGVDLARGHAHSGHALSLPAPLPGLFCAVTRPARSWGRPPPGEASPSGPAVGSGTLVSGRPVAQFMLRLQSGNGGEMARCDSGLSSGLSSACGRSAVRSGGSSPGTGEAR